MSDRVQSDRRVVGLVSALTLAVSRAAESPETASLDAPYRFERPGLLAISYWLLAQKPIGHSPIANSQ